jgi:hypothetical protein
MVTPGDVADVVVEEGPEVGRGGGDRRRAQRELRRILASLLGGEEHGMAALRMDPEHRRGVRPSR